MKNGVKIRITGYKKASVLHTGICSPVRMYGMCRELIRGINGDKDRNELNTLKKRAAHIKLKRQGLTKGSAEYNKPALC